MPTLPESRLAARGEPDSAFMRRDPHYHSSILLRVTRCLRAPAECSMGQAQIEGNKKEGEN